MSNRPGSHSPALSVGQTLDGKYRLLAVLGEGAMGTVYSAWHAGLEQRVAVKLLRSEDEQHDGVARQRFQREARAAARIHSEHVCRVLDTGSLADGTLYLVMEHLDGCDLSSELAKRGRLPLAEAVRYLRQTCAAVADAHRVGIVHRDLKPANLFLHEHASGERAIKILDFGVSKSSANHGQVSLTRTAALVGSPIYMSPEQLKSSRDVDGRTDIWALGSILVELLTGRPPFDEQSIGQLVSAVLYKESPSLRELGCDVPDALEAVVRKALHKEVEQRYQTAEQLSHALAPFEQGGVPAPLTSSHSRPVPLALGTSVADDSTSLSRSGARGVAPRVSTLPRPPRAARAYLLPVLLLVGALLALGVFALAGRGERRLGPPALPAAIKLPVAPPLPMVEPREADVTTELAQDAASALPPELPRAAPAPAAGAEASGEEPSRSHAERRRARSGVVPSEPTRTPQVSGTIDDRLPNFGGRR